MKFLDRMILCIFSVMMLLIAIFTCCTIFGWLDITTLYLVISNILKNTTACNVIIGVNAVFILLAIKAIFFEADSSEDASDEANGILLQNDDGKLLITKETLVSVVNSVVSGFESVKNSQTRIILDNDNNLSITLTIEVSNNAIIKELSNNIQIKVKDTIKKSMDVEVKSLDIRVKNMVKPQTEETK